MKLKAIFLTVIAFSLSGCAVTSSPVDNAIFTSLLYRGEMFLRGFDGAVRRHLREELDKKGHRSTDKRHIVTGKQIGRASCRERV